MAKGALSEYSAKRTFSATPEPPPGAAPADAGPLLFVVQQHAARRLHYDLRLECDGVLKSWAVPKGPSLDPDEKRLAVETEDHPYDYGSFEGVIPAGQYGAGQVVVWDCGVYTPDEEGASWFHDRARAEAEVREGLARGKLSFELRGTKLKGSFALVRTKEAKQWLLLKHRDRFASKGSDVTALDRSALTGQTVTAQKFVTAARLTAALLAPAGTPGPLPSRLAPMLAEPAAAAFAKDGWRWEPKLDGYRVLAFIDAGEVRLRSRRGLDLAPQFPALVAELALQRANGTVLDGEIVALDASGRPSFARLQTRAQLRTARELAQADRNDPVTFYAFDLPFFAGVDLRERPYDARRRYLEQCLLPSAHVRLVYASEDGVALDAAARAAGFEGVVGKRRDSRYLSGRRSAAWLKVKPVTTGEFVIGGYTQGKGARAPLGALVVGTYDGDALRYASHVGSGFDARALLLVQKRLVPLRRERCPFAEVPPANGPTTWVDPTQVAEVAYHSWTEDGALRAPVFVRLRDDVDPRGVRRVDTARDAADPPSGHERARSVIDDVVAQLDAARTTLALTVGEHTIRLTHLDRVYWPADATLDSPALTKRDLLRYFAQVSPYILPHLADRPLTMIRMPEGIAGERFFQKHWEQARPGFVDTVTVWSEHREDEHEYLVCNNLPTLLWLAQSGTLEFHVWHSRARPGPDCVSDGVDYATSRESLEASVLNYPDFVLFDLDPYIYSGHEAKGAEPELNAVAFEKAKEVAFWLRDLLAGMGLTAIVKTSGKTGLHVFVPIERTLDFDAARHVSELVGRHLMRRHPKDITMEWSVPRRTGRIFMDYNMNVRGKTLNVAYSPRGAPGAPVSMPLTWEELASAHPLDFRITNVPARLARLGDRWHDALERKQSFEAALDRVKG